MHWNNNVQKYFYDSESGLRHWKPCETVDLIEIFESHSYLFGVMSSDEDVWILIASALQRRGINVTGSQVKRKWLRMRSTFQNISYCKPNVLKPLCRHLRCNEEHTNLIKSNYRNIISPTQYDYENLKFMYELSKKKGIIKSKRIL